VVLVAKPMSNGKTHVVAVLQNASDALVNALYKQIAKNELDVQETQEVIEKEMAGLQSEPAANDSVNTNELAVA